MSVVDMTIFEVFQMVAEFLASDPVLSTCAIIGTIVVYPMTVGWVARLMWWSDGRPSLKCNGPTLACGNYMVPDRCRPCQSKISYHLWAAWWPICVPLLLTAAAVTHTLKILGGAYGTIVRAMFNAGSADELRLKDREVS